MSGTAQGFLGRLRRDVRGNTMAIVAVSIFPLVGMVGGAVDISRLYLTRTRLQQACDAGALAGRKSMSGITWATANETIANQFFDTNFITGKYGTGTKTRNYTASNTGAVSGTASVVVPMTLMSLFAMPSRTLTVTCTADLQLPNTDVMFVLDTTLSMADTNTGDTQSKITILRSAVQSFYAQLEGVKAVGSHIRYGFVPYSSTVNVGMLLQRDWVQDNPWYDSRVADGTSIVPGSTQGSTNSNTASAFVSGSQTTGTKYQGPAENCVAPANSGYTDVYGGWSAWNPDANTLPRTRTRSRTRNGTTYSASLSGTTCWITPTIFDNYKETQTETVTANPNAGQTGADSTVYHWIYQPVQYSMLNLKGSGAGSGLVTGSTGTTATTALVAQVANNQTNRTITWTQANGCIEERATRRTNETFLTPRYDMDVDLIPDPGNPATQWKPFLPGLVYGRVGGSNTATSGWVYSGSLPSSTRVLAPNNPGNYYTPFGDTTKYAACPTYARKMAELIPNNAANQPISNSVLNTYLNALTPAGYTYHDIGMLWGLRLISRDGIFGTENRAAESTGSISRNIIFMTDGDTDTRIQAYDAWGLSAVARRRTDSASIPTDAAQDAVTEARLRELCTIAKNDKNITVWVIAFGTTLTQLLTDCASPGRAYQANNAAELAQTFSQIASQIAQLRLTQ